MRREAAVAFGVCVVLATLVAMHAGEKPPDPYMDAVGVLRGLEVLPGEQEGRGFQDFCFRFTPQGEKTRWMVISRSSTPFLRFRLGPTYVDFTKENLPDGSLVRVMGVKKVDRVPPAFHDRQLPADKTLTAFIVALSRDGKETPVYVNNWFHPWRQGVEGILDPGVTRHYVDREGPYWVCGWLPVDRSPEMAPDKRFGPVRELLGDDVLRKLQQKQFDKAAYKGFLVSSKEGKLGYKLKAEQLWIHVGGGNYELLVGTEQGLELLEPPGEGGRTKP